MGVQLALLLLAACLVQVAVVSGTDAGSTQQGTVSGVVLPGQPSPAVEDMLAWVRSNHGQVNVAVRDAPGVGRFTVAPRDIAKGDILAIIPTSICLNVTVDTADVESAVKLWCEMQNLSSPLVPYLRALPSRSQVFSQFNMPESYLPLIQNEAVANHIKDRKQMHQMALELLPADGAGQATSSRTMNASTLQYMMSLMKTRAFNANDWGKLMVPVIDLANHHNFCPHTIIPRQACGPEVPEGCVVWLAGEDVPAGSEVCNGYVQFMPQDRAMLMYGMLQRDAPAAMLAVIDRHDFDPQKPFDNMSDNNLEPFEGNKEEMQAEVTRLDKLLADMQRLDSSVDFAPDPVVDPSGAALSNLHRWRTERKAAIVAERARLTYLLHQATAAGSSSGAVAEL